jgi:hypothetical protein
VDAWSAQDVRQWLKSAGLKRFTSSLAHYAGSVSSPRACLPRAPAGRLAAPGGPAARLRRLTPRRLPRTCAALQALLRADVASLEQQLGGAKDAEAAMAAIAALKSGDTLVGCCCAHARTRRTQRRSPPHPPYRPQPATGRA